MFAFIIKAGGNTIPEEEEDTYKDPRQDGRFIERNFFGNRQSLLNISVTDDSD
jgi:hypothetical protein